jgi:hypothetical protein
VACLRKCIALGIGIPEMRTEMSVMLGFGVMLLVVAVSLPSTANLVLGKA